MLKDGSILEGLKYSFLAQELNRKDHGAYAQFEKDAYNKTIAALEEETKVPSRRKLPAVLDDVNTELIGELFDLLQQSGVAIPDGSGASQELEEAANASTIVPKHARAMLSMAEKRREMVGFRETSRKTQELLASGKAAAKGLHIKGKSNTEDGLIHVNQEYAKPDQNALDKCDNNRRRAYTHRTRTVLTSIEEGYATAAQQQGEKYDLVPVPKADELADGKDAKMWDGDRPLGDKKTNETVDKSFVLATKLENALYPITGDYDGVVLAGGREGIETICQGLDADMDTLLSEADASFKTDLFGETTRRELGGMWDYNIAVRNTGYEAGQVVRHGYEARNVEYVQEVKKNLLLKGDLSTPTATFVAGADQTSGVVPRAEFAVNPSLVPELLSAKQRGLNVPMHPKYREQVAIEERGGDRRQVLSAGAVRPSSAEFNKHASRSIGSLRERLGTAGAYDKELAEDAKKTLTELLLVRSTARGADTDIMATHQYELLKPSIQEYAARFENDFGEVNLPVVAQGSSDQTRARYWNERLPPLHAGQANQSPVDDSSNEEDRASTPTQGFLPKLV